MDRRPGPAQETPSSRVTPAAGTQSAARPAHEPPATAWPPRPEWSGSPTPAAADVRRRPRSGRISPAAMGWGRILAARCARAAAGVRAGAEGHDAAAAVEAVAESESAWLVSEDNEDSPSVYFLSTCYTIIMAHALAACTSSFSVSVKDVCHAY